MDVGVAESEISVEPLFTFCGLSGKPSAARSAGQDYRFYDFQLSIIFTLLGGLKIGKIYNLLIRMALQLRHKICLVLGCSAPKVSGLERARDFETSDSYRDKLDPQRTHF